MQAEEIAATFSGARDKCAPCSGPKAGVFVRSEAHVRRGIYSATTCSLKLLSTKTRTIPLYVRAVSADEDAFRRGEKRA
jgi:hypothetical protein